MSEILESATPEGGGLDSTPSLKGSFAVVWDYRTRPPEDPSYLARFVAFHVHTCRIRQLPDPCIILSRVAAAFFLKEISQYLSAVERSVLIRSGEERILGVNVCIPQGAMRPLGAVLALASDRLVMYTDLVTKRIVNFDEHATLIVPERWAIN